MASYHENELDSEDTESGSSGEDAGTSEDESATWISWFCSLKGNEFFCEIDDDYIQDDFNLSGLNSQVCAAPGTQWRHTHATQVPVYYEFALDVILDAESPNADDFNEETQEIIESAAEALYGLIHSRYILTTRGMQAMFEKYQNADFGTLGAGDDASTLTPQQPGRCPRVYCDGQPCLPVGLSDVPRQSTVKIFCPKCEDIYYPRSRYQGQVDGAFFGTTFPHLFLLTYSSLRPPKPLTQYVPKVFGFKIHPTAYQRGGMHRGDNGRGRGRGGVRITGGEQAQDMEQQPQTSNCGTDMQQ